VKGLRHVVTTVLVLFVACADPPAPGEEGPPNVPAVVPDVAEIVCEADGSTTVRTPQVVVQPDGIHVHVVNRLDEPASVNGFGFDIDEGDTTHVTGRAPAVIQTACWPFSQHSGEEPTTTPLEVLDPEGIYVDGEIECTGMASSMVADFSEAPIDDATIPLDAARAAIEGLEESDEVSYAGYPAQRGPVIVVREERVVASFGFSTFDREHWVVASATICESSGLSSS
jgi:hypothetical protein